MVNTVAHPGPFDPLDRADPDQPFFPLMAGDPHAPALVIEWAERTRTDAREIEDEDERRRKAHKCLEAEEIAWAMQRWTRTGSTADTRAAATRETYAGSDLPADHRWKEQLSAGTASLRNAASYFSDAAAGLPIGQAQAIAEAIETINVIATAYEPRRASYGTQSELPLTYAEIGVA